GRGADRPDEGRAPHPCPDGPAADRGTGPALHGGLERASWGKCGGGHGPPRRGQSTGTPTGVRQRFPDGGRTCPPSPGRARPPSPCASRPLPVLRTADGAVTLRTGDGRSVGWATGSPTVRAGGCAIA